MFTLAKSDPPTRRATGASAPFGVYVHFPWCIRKCPYCDFLSVVAEPESIPHAAYLDRVLTELDARRGELAGRSVSSVFVGGGTPSLWDPAAIGRLLDALAKALGLRADAEVTVECNPSSFDKRRAQALRQAGANRVSIGVQSLNAERLAFLGRWHSPAEALCAVRDALDSGIERVSADLIYGVSGQSPESAAEEARELASTGLTHLSAYTLTIEPGTRFGARARQGSLPLLPEDSVADSFVAVHQALESQGFEHYEISNFAKLGHHALHNLGYWRGADYLGLGAGAWGTVETRTGKLRYRNTPSIERYLDSSLPFTSIAQDHQRGLVQELEPIDAETALAERLLLGLRLSEGVDLGRAGRELGIDPWTRERERAIEGLVSRGLLSRKGDWLGIPAGQWLLADGTIAALL